MRSFLGKSPIASLITLALLGLSTHALADVPLAPGAAPSAATPAAPSAATPAPTAAPSAATPAPTAAPSAATPPSASASPAAGPSASASMTPPPPPPPATVEPTPTDADPPRPAREELPIDLRGELGLHTASYTDGADALSVIAMRIVASVPVTERVFIDARLPLALALDRTTNGTLGNLMLGVHATTSLGKTTWLSYGGAFGVPLLSGRAQRDDGYATAQIPNAFWNLHEYSPANIPVELRLGLEHLMDPFTFRAEIAPVVMAPLGRNEQVEVVFLHAAEAQIGNTLGAGVRLQGVALPTSKELEYTSLSMGSAYQAAIEPFVVVQKPRYFFRTGFMLPLSNPLGYAAFGLKTYGVHLAMGIHLD